MGIKIVFFIFSLALLASGCKKAIEHPENSDPVYNNLKKQASKTYSDYKSKEKDVLSARKAYDEASIRTGQRQETHDEYFNQLNELEKLAETYRYLSLKVEKQRKNDFDFYQEAYKNNEPWPNPKLLENYEIEKRLASAPREWSPENRIKEREMEKENARKSASKSERSE